MASVFRSVGKIFSPKMPKVEPTAAMPDPESVSAKLAARDKIEKRKASGRSGTIYTSSSGAYTGANLGATA